MSYVCVCGVYIIYIFCLFIKEIYDKIVLLNLREISLQKKQGKHGSELWAEWKSFSSSFFLRTEWDENNLWDMEQWEGELQWQQICLWCSAPESFRHYTKLTASLMTTTVVVVENHSRGKFLNVENLKIILLD
jgi:hypothetical protein